VVLPPYDMMRRAAIAAAISHDSINRCKCSRGAGWGSTGNSGAMLGNEGSEGLCLELKLRFRDYPIPWMLCVST